MSTASIANPKTNSAPSTDKAQYLDDLYQGLRTDHRKDLPRYEDDPHSIDIEGVYRLRCTQYIGEDAPHPSTEFSPLDAISALIKNEQRLILRANAGMGKSTLCITLARRLELLGLRKMVILEPTTTIANQLGADFAAYNPNIENNARAISNELQKVGINAPVLDNQARRADILGAQSSSVVVCCYDSLGKLGSSWIDDKTLVVVDEFHQLVTEVNYRTKTAFQYALEHITRGGRTLMLSATPFDLFTLPKKSSPHFGYKMAMCEADIQQSINVQPVIYTGRRKDIVSYHINQAERGGGLTCIKFDDTKNLKTGKTLAIKKGLSCEYFSAKERSQKEGNADYKRLVKKGKLKNKIDVLLYTKLLEAGVSIKDPVKQNILVDVKGWGPAIQLMSRPRYNHATGVNKTQLVQLYRSADNIRKKEKEQQKYIPSARWRFNGLAKEADELCKYKNQRLSKDQIKAPVSTDTQKERYLTIKIETAQGPKYIRNTLWILHMLHLQSEAVTFDLMLKRLVRFDNRITLLPAQNIKLPKCPITEGYRDELKAKTEAEDRRLASLLFNNFNNMLALCIDQMQNRKWKEQFKAAYPQAAKITRADVLEFKRKHSIKGIKKVSKLVDQYHLITSSNPTLKGADVLHFVCSMDGDDVAEYCDQLNAHTRRVFNKHMPQDLDPNDRFFAEREKAVVKKLQGLKQDSNRGKGKEWRTKPDWAKIVNKALLKEDKKLGQISATKAMQLIRHLYNVESKRAKIKGKKTTFIKLLDRREFVELDQLMPNEKPTL